MLSQNKNSVFEFGEINYSRRCSEIERMPQTVEQQHFNEIYWKNTIDVIIPLRRVSTSQRQNTQHRQHQTYYQPRYPTRKTTYVRSRAV